MMSISNSYSVVVQELSSPQLPSDTSVRRVELHDSKRVVGSLLLTPGGTSSARTSYGAELFRLQRASELSELWLANDAPNHKVLPLLCYAALRTARLAQSTQILVATRDQSPLASLLCLKPLRAGQLPNEPTLALGAQRIDYAINRAFDAANETGERIYSTFLVAELQHRLERYVAQIWRTKFYVATMNGELSREQYVYALSNKYQFVRYTTRILGRAIAYSNTTELRSHFVRHLQGEVNHELIIEKDLTALGADVDYVKHRMVPNASTRQFMCAQESTIAFHEDPVSLMAAPLAAEMITARLPAGYLDALHECARKWGIDKPTTVTQFLSSHVHTDGADDGHLAGTLKALSQCIVEETELQRFISVLDVCTDAFRRGYDAMVDEVSLWSAAE